MEIPLGLRKTGNGAKEIGILSVLLDIIHQERENQDTRKPNRNSRD